MESSLNTPAITFQTPPDASKVISGQEGASAQGQGNEGNTGGGQEALEQGLTPGTGGTGTTARSDAKSSQHKSSSKLASGKIHSPMVFDPAKTSAPSIARYLLDQFVVLYPHLWGDERDILPHQRPVSKMVRSWTSIRLSEELLEKFREFLNLWRFSVRDSHSGTPLGKVLAVWKPQLDATSKQMGIVPDHESAQALRLVQRFLGPHLVYPCINAIQMNADRCAVYNEQEWRARVWDTIVLHLTHMQSGSPLAFDLLRNLEVSSHGASGSAAETASVGIARLKLEQEGQHARVDQSTLGFDGESSSAQAEDLESASVGMARLRLKTYQREQEAQHAREQSTTLESSMAKLDIGSSESRTSSEYTGDESEDVAFIQSELRMELMINYPRFEEYDHLQQVANAGNISEQGQGVAGHSQFAEVLAAQMQGFRALYSKKSAPAGSLLHGLETRNNNAREFIVKLSRNPMETVLQDFTNVLSDYPYQGKVDATWCLRDDAFYWDVVKAFDGNTTRARSFLNTFLCVNEQPETGPLYIPYLLIEYKKQTGLENAQNQRAMYCNASARFLASLGIFDYPVYGAATEGSTITFCAAWVSESDPQLCHIVYGDEQPTYDVEDMADLAQFYIFVDKIRRRAEENLADRYKKNRAALLDRIKLYKEVMEPWTARGQLLQYGLINPNPRIPKAKITYDDAWNNAKKDLMERIRVNGMDEKKVMDDIKEKRKQRQRLLADAAERYRKGAAVMKEEHGGRSTRGLGRSGLV